MITRTLCMLVCMSFAAVAHAELPPPPDRPELVAACAEATVLPEGRTADASTILAYCGCAMEEAASVLTPAEFELFSIVSVASARNLPMPTDEDVVGIDLQSFRAHSAEGIVRMRRRCNPIIFGPQE
jgi:hypothetical protein